MLDFFGRKARLYMTRCDNLERTVRTQSKENSKLIESGKMLNEQLDKAVAEAAQSAHDKAVLLDERDLRVEAAIAVLNELPSTARMSKRDRGALEAAIRHISEE